METKPKHKRWTIKSVADFVEQSNSGCKVVSEEYKNLKEPMQFTCACGNEFTCLWESFVNLNKRQCNECGYNNSARKRSKTHEQFEQEVYNLVGTEYIVSSRYENSLTKIDLVHQNCNRTYSVTPNNFLNGRRCTCKKQSSVKIKDQRSLLVFNFYGLMLFSIEYDIVVLLTLFDVYVHSTFELFLISDYSTFELLHSNDYSAFDTFERR